MVGSTFQVLDGVVLRPVPWPRSDRLDEMPLQAVVPIFSRAEVADLRTLAASESLDAYSLRVFTIAQPGEARQVEGGRATGSLFGTLAASAAAGRLLAHRDSEPGGGPVAVLSNGYWRDAYGGESRVVGSTIDIVDEAGAVHAYTIVGVLPRNAGYPFSGTSVWLPVTMDPTASDYDAKNADLHPIARLAEGHGVAPAQSMVTATVKGWVDRLPPGAFGTAERRVAYRARIDAAVIPLSRRASADSRRLVWSLFCFALVVLAISAGHVANVQFARGIRRSREFGIRYQLGASRRRLVALVLGESAVFALLAALGGVAVIAISSAFTRSHLPVQVAAESPVLRGMTLFAILATACVVALVLGVAGGVLGVESRAMHSPGS